MKEAIWATYYHYSSTDTKPQHDNCPKGPDSWCAWQRASATNTLSSFKHEYTPLPDEVLIAMKPLYDDLSKDELLERCVGGFTQNNNESFNQLIWKITPKILPAGSKIVNIAALVAACIFNEGTSALLLIMHGMDLKLGRNSHEYARISDENRVCAAEKKSCHQQEQKDALDIATAAGSLLCGPGIDDSLFKNGSLTRERLRNNCADGSWDIFNELIESTPRGNFGNMGLYYDAQEIIPFLKGDYRFNKADNPVNRFTSYEVEIRAVIEGQFLARRAHAEDIGFHLGPETKILVTGGASKNKAILQVLSDVFNAPVYTQETANSAVLGASYQAKHGLFCKEKSYDEITSVLPLPTLVCEPFKDASEIYDPMVLRYRNIVKKLLSEKN